MMLNKILDMLKLKKIKDYFLLKILEIQALLQFRNDFEKSK